MGPARTHRFWAELWDLPARTTIWEPAAFNYAYLGGTAQTAAGAAPGPGASAFDDSTGIPEDIESATWSLNGSNTLLPQWLNTDLSQPPIFIMDITNILRAYRRSGRFSRYVRFC